jgi:flagella basal body P-ring formation protein FlgA
MRSAILSAALAAAVIMAGHSAIAATLKRAVTVKSEDVRLSDVFAGSDVAGDVVVGRAPAPGRKLVLGPHRLKSIARANGLDWKPANRHSRVVITRAARLIDTGEIEIALRQALTRQGLTKEHRIELFNRTVRVYVPVDATQPYEIRNARFDTSSGRFTASLVVTDNSEIQKIVGLNGRIYSVIEIPVLNRPMRPGDVITRGDVEWAAIRANTADRNAVVDLAEIIGQTPRRSLRAGMPIKRRDVRAPVVVAKGSIVMLELRTRRMTLIAKVKAAEDGAKGQTIRLLNTRSNRTVEGVVVGPGRVVVPNAIFPTSGS